MGSIASKKIDTVTTYIYDYQKKLFYNTYTKRKISKAYRLFLLARMFTIFQNSCGKLTFSSIKDYIKDNQKEYQQIKKAKEFADNKIKERHQKIFFWIKRQAQGHFQGFARLIHIENVFIFYRLAYSFAAVKRVYTAEKYKAMHKMLEDQGSILKEREENKQNMINTR